ncbi:MAG: hypothetical protein ACRD16_05365 [Thermoanaerobaculia bacterium]
MVKFAALVLLAFASAVGGDTLVLKSGEKFELKSPASHKNGRVTFTTTTNRFLSVEESEVAKEILGPPPPPPRQINRTDSRQLGAIAREQREQRGKSAPVAGKPVEKKKSSDSSKTSRKKKGDSESGETPPSSDHRR